MAEQTTNYQLQKPEYHEYVDIGVLNENFDAIDAALTEIAGRGTYDFDNLLAYPGCTCTLEKEDSTYTEQIKTQGGILRAKRVTVVNGAESYTETYTFYAEDGTTAAAQFTVQTTKDGEGNWQEEVTEEESA